MILLVSSWLTSSVFWLADFTTKKLILEIKMKFSFSKPSRFNFARSWHISLAFVTLLKNNVFVTLSKSDLIGYLRSAWGEYCVGE